MMAMVISMLGVAGMESSDLAAAVCTVLRIKEARLPCMT